MARFGQTVSRCFSEVITSVRQSDRQTAEHFPKRVGPQVPKLKYGPPPMLIANQLKMALILTGILSNC